MFEDFDQELRERISGIVRETLGPPFEVRLVAVGRGSIEVIVLIGTTYYAISRYKNFVESIELVVRQITDLVRHIFGRATPTPVTATGTWAPAQGMLAALPRRRVRAGSSLVLWYLILSHAAMMVVILWFVLSRGTP
jgi:hypothetical protein